MRHLHSHSLSRCFYAAAQHRSYTVCQITPDTHYYWWTSVFFYFCCDESEQSKLESNDNDYNFRRASHHDWYVPQCYMCLKLVLKYLLLRYDFHCLWTGMELGFYITVTNRPIRQDLSIQIGAGCPKLLFRTCSRITDFPEHTDPFCNQRCVIVINFSLLWPRNG